MSLALSPDRKAFLEARMRQIDHRRMVGLVKSKKPTAGLTKQGAIWKLLYYTSTTRTTTATLGPVTQEEAVWMRDQLYARAKKAGAGFRNRKAIQAKEILRNPFCHDCIVFQVCMNGTIKRFTDLRKAIEWRNATAQQIIDSNLAAI